MGTSYIDNLLSKIDDESLRTRLTNEINKLRDNKEFGLVFERHIPEYVRIYKREITEGAHVQLRFSKSDDIFTVREIKGKKARIADKDDKISDKKLDELVVVIRHGDSIYPGLVEVDRVERGGDKPFHTVINAENYHALQLLLYTHEGKIDCIYIDPPYNTGAKDWKYNNDYVDSEDRYRHSKWLSFMEKRLLLCKKLLNKEEATLVLTIDENELPRITILLQQIFPSSRLQMITNVITPGGTSRKSGFSRVEEYLLFLFIGNASIGRTFDSMLGEVVDQATNVEGLFEIMVRRGKGVVRKQRPKQFYPIFINEKEKKVVEIGESLSLEVSRKSIPEKKGLLTVWPIKPDGEEGFWQLRQASLRESLDDGTAKVHYNKSTKSWTIKYMKEANANAVKDGRIIVKSTLANGDKEFEITDAFSKPVTPKTVWNRQSHDASVHGARLVRKLVPGRLFPFPKSLYAVEDCIRFLVGHKPSAKVLDFFAGSGTTCHAVMRLNKADGGNRVSISVTNNALSEEEEKRMLAEGEIHGTEKYESIGIFNHITMPRIKAATTGIDYEGKSIPGNYIHNDIFPISNGINSNIAFLELDYLQIDSTRRNNEFEQISLVLWMISGSLGSVISSVSDTFSLQAEGNYGILFNIDHWQEFVNEVKQIDTITHAFIITDSKVQYQQVVKHLPTNIETTMLYEDYLRNFQIGV